MLGDGNAELVTDSDPFYEEEFDLNQVDELWIYGWSDLNYVFSESFQGPVRGLGYAAKIGETWLQIEAENQSPRVVFLAGPSDHNIVFGYRNVVLTQGLMVDMVKGWVTNRNQDQALTP